MTTTRTPIGWRAGHGQNIVESTSCKTESGPQNLPEMPAYRRLHPHRLDGSQSLTPADRTTGRSPARSTSEQTGDGVGPPARTADSFDSRQARGPAPPSIAGAASKDDDLACRLMALTSAARAVPDRALHLAPTLSSCEGRPQYSTVL